MDTITKYDVHCPGCNCWYEADHDPYESEVECPECGWAIKWTDDILEEGVYGEAV